MECPHEDTPPEDTAHESVRGRRVALVGRLEGMSKREAQALIRAGGGFPLECADAGVELLVVGDRDSLAVELIDALDESLRRAIENGEVQVVSESQLWQQLGLVEGQQQVKHLYTPAMLADLLGVPVAVVRRWHRRGLIVPSREVRKLPYFDFQEVAAARTLAKLLAAGVTPAAIEKKLAAVRRLLPRYERPLAQLSAIVEGKELLLRQGDGLVEPGGQMRFDFETPAGSANTPDRAGAEGRGDVRLESLTYAAAAGRTVAETALHLCQTAAALDDAGDLAGAADSYRAALAAAGANAEICFRLAETLYRLGDVAAARERYYMAIEIDEDYVEARANLGCVLAESGQLDLAVAAFEGALDFHADYPDVHYHLARILDEQGDIARARDHWLAFIELSPASPWADTARERLAHLQ